MALTSPGVEVSVINESFYVPSDAGTTPLFIVASQTDKTKGSGNGTAAGTQSATAALISGAYFSITDCSAFLRAASRRAAASTIACSNIEDIKINS